MMNELIKELADQAGVLSRDFVGAGVYSIHNADEVERFAELLIRECAKLATEEYDKRGAIHGQDLLDHFGIK